MLALRSRLTAPRRPGQQPGLKVKSRIYWTSPRLSSTLLSKLWHPTNPRSLPSTASPYRMEDFQWTWQNTIMLWKFHLIIVSNHIHWKFSTEQTQQTITIINKKLAISRAIYKNRTNRIKIISNPHWRSHFLCLGMLFCFLMKINHLSLGPHISCWHSLVESQHWYLILIFLFQQTLIIHNVTRPV